MKFDNGMECNSNLDEGLNNGTYYRDGGVIRKNAGRKPIVGHLKDSDKPNTSESNIENVASAICLFANAVAILAPVVINVHSYIRNLHNTQKEKESVHDENIVDFKEYKKHA